MGKRPTGSDSSGLTLGTIRAVAEALRTRSMTEAALVLGVSQSAVTQQVSKFEAQTGVKILRRVGNTLFIEREDIADLMERITVLSQRMERLVQDKTPSKATLALPSAIAALIAVHPELSAWTAERFRTEILSFKDLAKQRAQNTFDYLLRPLRPREADIDYQFDCQFQMLKPRTWSERGSEPAVLPVMLPGGDCPTHAAAVDFLRSHDLAFEEVSRSEEVTYRALNLARGVAATLLPWGFAEHSLADGKFESSLRLGEPFSVRFGLEVIRGTAAGAGALSFIDQFCGELKDHGVAMAA